MYRLKHNFPTCQTWIEDGREGHLREAIENFPGMEAVITCFQQTSTGLFCEQRRSGGSHQMGLFRCNQPQGRIGSHIYQLQGILHKQCTQENSRTISWGWKNRDCTKSGYKAKTFASEGCCDLCKGNGMRTWFKAISGLQKTTESKKPSRMIHILQTNMHWSATSVQELMWQMGNGRIVDFLLPSKQYWYTGSPW